jgi:hypothetical protein
LKCNRDQGREAIPEICTRYYRNCNGVQVYLDTVCVGAIRGSDEHRFLLAVCEFLGAATSAPAIDEQAVPADFDAEAFFAKGVSDPSRTSPNVSDVSEFDFPNDGVAGPVAAHRHPIGRGIVADSVKLLDPETVYIAPETLVYGNAILGSDVTILGRGQVYGDARVSTGSFVGDDAQVFGTSVLEYGAGALERSRVDGAWLVCGGMTRDDAVVGEKVVVSGMSCSK